MPPPADLHRKGSAPEPERLISQLTRRVNAESAALIRDPEAANAQRRRGHRGLMAMVKTVVLAQLLDRQVANSEQHTRAASAWLSDLEALQTSAGLFTSGDNVTSPPDSAFTITDVAIVLRLLGEHQSHTGVRLTAILERAVPALVRGGVHTPNHRWELAGALGLAADLVDGELAGAARDRAQDWLGEGIDVDPDGLYSERSPNYAARVSNPALLVLAEISDREDLRQIVHLNLHAQLDLSGPDGTVETIHSRRQDQKDGPFPLGPFLAQFADFATECARCRAGAALAAHSEGVDAVEVLARSILAPGVAAGLREACTWVSGGDEEQVERWFAAAKLFRRRRGRTWMSAYGGSDVDAAGRVASGLACNPTFLRFGAEDIEISSVRLSRDFFSLGPFRAATIERSGPDEVVLREHVSAAYYQPLPAGARRADGSYALEYEGRFAAAMGFAQRHADTVALRTTVVVRWREDGADLVLSTDGPPADHALELAVPAGTTVHGAEDLGDGEFGLGDDRVLLRRGRSSLSIEADPPRARDVPAAYHPGEAYTFLGGTDAVSGTRLYLTWRSPGAVTVRLRTL